MSKATTLDQLKLLAQRTNSKITAIDKRIDDIVSTGGEPNKIEKIQRNGVELEILEGKIVNVTVPTKVGDLDNDQKFQTESQVAATVAAADHLKRKIVASTDAIDPAAADAGQYIYMILKSTAKNGDKYDEYMVIDGAVEKVGDWSIDLSGYQPKEDSKGLSTNDYTDADKAKVDGVAAGATKVEASETPGHIKINGTDTAVVDMATDDEVTAMLNEVFGEATA